MRILHAADLHLDSPFEGLSEEQAALRRREQRGLLDKLCELASDTGAQLMLLAGDLLDSADAYAETAGVLCAALGRLKIPVFLAPGNHDFYSRHCPYARLKLPENVHIFHSPRLTCAELPELGARVWGAGYADSACPPLLRGFVPEKREGTLDLLVLHAEVTSAPSRYCPVTERELAQSGFDYAALGHVHTCSGLRRAGDCFYAWPGCPEGRGFDECGEKGAAVVDVAPGRCEFRLAPLGGRRYEQLSVAAGDDPLKSVLDRLPPETKRDVYRIVLTGECAAAPDLSALYTALEGRFFALSLRDRTVPRRDMWERMDEDSLPGLFLRRMRAAYDAAPDEESRGLALMAARAGLAALEGSEEKL